LPQFKRNWISFNRKDNKGISRKERKETMANYLKALKEHRILSQKELEEIAKLEIF
jgi:hypothetical protein